MESTEMTNTVSLEIRPDNVAVISLDVPESSQNTFSQTLLTELEQALKTVSAAGSVKALVITSAKKDFGAGANLDQIEAIQKTGDPTAIVEAVDFGNRVYDLIPSLSIPVVAAIAGNTLGGAAELAIKGLENGKGAIVAKADAKIGWPEIMIGLLPGWGGNSLLPHIIGIKESLRLVTTGKTITAKEALKLGLVARIVKEDEDLVESACRLALGLDKGDKKSPAISKERLLRKALRLPGVWSVYKAILRMTVTNTVSKQAPKGAPAMIQELLFTIMRNKAPAKFCPYPAPPKVLEVIIESIEKGLKAGRKLERRYFIELANSDVSGNLVQFANFERTTRSKARNTSVDLYEIKRVGVVGLGVMGAPIAQLLATSGYEVVAKEINESALEAGMGRIDGLFDEAVKRGKLSPSDKDAALARIKPTVLMADLGDCQLVIEAIIEKLAAKQSLIEELDPPLFASNTSSLSINEIINDRDTAGGIHFFNPPYRLKGVEVIRGDKTSQKTIDTFMAFVSSLKMVPVEVKDSPGFVVNRLLTPYMRSALKLMGAGVSPKDIDRAMKKAFQVPMGPLEVLDQVGLKVGLEVIKQLHAAFGERLSPPLAVSTISALMSGNEKMLGKQSGLGIYVYENGKKAGVNQGLIDAIGVPVKRMQDYSIQTLLSLAMINEAAFLLQEGVVATAAEVDLLMILCSGFAPHLGGLLKYADSIGLNTILQNLEDLASIDPDYEPAPLLKQLIAEKKSFYQFDARKRQTVQEPLILHELA